MDETREDLQRSEIEVKKYLQKSEVLENENEMIQTPLSDIIE